jgi:homoserine kinase
VRATASAPASTANLGPGYDVLGLALGLRCSVTAETADQWAVEHIGEHPPGPGEPDAVLAAAQHAVGDRPLTMTVDNEIPLGKGVGSSSAALVAGAAAALRATDGAVSPDRVFRIAAQLEGHPEQVAACVYGGLVLVPASGLPMRLPLHPSLRPVVGIAQARLSTTEARGVVRKEQDLDVVVRSLARLVALTAGLITGDAGMLDAAHGDEIHESPRAEIDPEVDDLIRLAKRAGALHGARSGAGPSVVALATVESADRVAAVFVERGLEVLNRPVETTGLA